MSEVTDIVIPDKTYFKIGEVAKLLDLEPYVLRYWESEFDMLVPEKTDSGQRIYQREDIELICQIRGLLYDEMFTIAGARRQLELEVKGEPSFASAEGPAEGAAQNVASPESAQIELWEQRLTSQSEEIKQLEAQLARAQQHTEELQALKAELEQARHASDEIQALKAELAEAQQAAEELEGVQAQLAQATQTIKALKARPAPKALGTIDPTILQGLRHQVESLAALGRQPN